MPLDARDVASGTTLEADLCIVGAGAAGITLARALADAPLDVLLLEAGGETPSAEEQALYEGPLLGRDYYPLHSCRLRALGGTTNHWAGVCQALDPIDFEARDWVPHSGWPLDHAELAPYVERARAVLELGDDPTPMGARRPPGASDAIPFDAEAIQTAVLAFSPPTRFGSRYGAALDAAPRIRVMLHANVVEIERPAEEARVTGVRVRTLDGGELRVRARATVLAAGAIENARLLLLSDRVEANGLGNRHDLVGRYFMEHPHLDHAGEWVLADGHVHRTLYVWPDPKDGYRGASMGVLAFPEAVARREQLLGWSCELRLVSEAQQSEGFQALRALLGAARRGRVPDDFGSQVADLMADLDGAFGGLVERATDVPGEGARYVLYTRSEQSPNPESRVRLTEERDALGLRRAGLDWRLREQDLHSLRHGLALLARQVGAQDFGRVAYPEADEGAWTEAIRGGWHHMGTTRMADDPRRGVVDRDGRVHGTGGLYVAGSSVFPTAGWANPTLSIVALALRLADHLRGELT